MSDKTRASYPWTKYPLVCNGPMRGFAGESLASEVSKAGGIGFIGATSNMTDVSAQLDEARKLLSGVPSHDGKLPIGVGFLVCFTDRAEAVSVIAKHKPAIVWLFAANALQDYADWAQDIRRACQADIWIQTGSVGDALAIARCARPDVLVLQGSDAGGHGLEKGAGFISLLPEAADDLEKDGFGGVPLVAAGGIVDGRGVAAALALGACGAVMGTRFLASDEVVLPHREYVEALLKAEDGGQSTVRSKVFDELNAQGNIWPASYDGRGLTNLTYHDSVKGLGIEENRRLHQAAAAQPDKGYGKGEKRVTIWSGTGVGLVRELKSARAIVEETRAGAQKLVTALQTKM